MQADLNKVLIIDEDQGFLQTAKDELKNSYKVEVTNSGKDGIYQFRTFEPNVVILDSKVSDISFVELMRKFRKIDHNVIRIVVSDDFSKIDSVLEAINEVHVHNYFRKPLNFSDLRTTIQAKMGDYHIVKGHQAFNENVTAVYSKLETILDQVEASKKIEEMSKAHVDKATAMEVESLAKIRDTMEQLKASQNHVKHLEDVVEGLKEKAREYESLKARNVDIVENERNEYREALEKAKEDYDKVVEEKEEIEDTLREMEVTLESRKESVMKVSADFATTTREKKNGKDSLLCVDDETEITSSFQKLFGKIYNVYTANNGKEALQVLQDNPDICIVVSDQRMPKMTGIELANEIQEIKPDLPVFLLTGYTDIDIAIEALNKGTILKYFEKPMDFDEMSESLEVAIEDYDQKTASREIIEDKKTFVVDRMREVTTEMKNFKSMNKKLEKDLAKAKNENSSIARQLENKKKDILELRTAVEQERKKMFEDMKLEKQEFNNEMAIKREEAKQIVEATKKRNESDLEKLQEAFDADKVKVQAEIEQMKKDLEEERKKMLAEMEERKNELTKEEDELKGSLDKSKAELKEKLEKENAELEKQIAEQKAKADKEVEAMKTKVEREQKKLAEKFEKETVAKRDAAFAEYEKMKTELQQKEEKITAVLKEAAESVKDKDRQIDDLQDKVAEAFAQRDKAQSEIDDMKDEFNLLVASREALEAELAELRG